MKIKEYLLDTNNGTPINGSTVSERIRKQGKEHLWDERSSPCVDTVVIHYISAKNIDGRRRYDLPLVLKIFCDYGVSSHYLIERNGRIICLVPEEKKAWHAGGSIMPLPDGRIGVNDFSIGIELMATHDSGFTQKQYSSCARLCRDIEKRLGKKFKYVGHSDIAGKKAKRLCLRKDIKPDPGPLFDWAGFRKLLRSKATKSK